jgi:hypothetical protein
MTAAWPEIRGRPSSTGWYSLTTTRDDLACGTSVNRAPRRVLDRFGSPELSDLPADELSDADTTAG